MNFSPKFFSCSLMRPVKVDISADFPSSWLLSCFLSFCKFSMFWSSSCKVEIQTKRLSGFLYRWNWTARWSWEIQVNKYRIAKTNCGSQFQRHFDPRSKFQQIRGNTKHYTLKECTTYSPIKKKFSGKIKCLFIVFTLRLTRNIYLYITYHVKAHSV